MNIRDEISKLKEIIHVDREKCYSRIGLLSHQLSLLNRMFEEDLNKISRENRDEMLGMLKDIMKDYYPNLNSQNEI